MTRTRYDQQWAEAFLDRRARLRWREHFPPNAAGDATRYRAHFTDPAAAAAWWGTGIFAPDVCAYLHRHHVTPDPDTLRHALRTAAAEQGHPFVTLDSLLQEHHSAALLLAHPHLAPEDRTTLTGAGLTLTEVDHLITTGTYDRATVALMAGLT